MVYVTGDLSEAELYRRSAATSSTRRRRRQDRGQCDLLSGDRRPVLLHGGRALCQGGADRTDAGRGRPAEIWRRVVIEKPFGHSLDSARALNARILRTPARRPDLPHRPFSRQGHGPEHHGVALRQRPVRADLEPRPHRSCADHRGRDGRRGDSAANSTRRPAPCATWCPTICSRCCRWWRWSRRSASTPPRSCSKKAEVLCRHASRRSRMRAVRGQYGAGAGAGQAGEALSRGSRCRAAIPTSKPMSRCELEIDNWRWAGVPFYLRTGKHLSRA